MRNIIELNLEMIIDEYSNYVFKIVNNIVGSYLPYQDKEEIVSDTFYLLWKNQDKVDNNLKSYLGTIARNCSYDKLRKNNITVSIEDDDSFSYNADIDTIIDMKEKLKKLTSEEIVIFNLYYLKGLKVKEIGSRLNKSPSSIKISLYRLRKKLKEEN